jgi:DNA polymerase-3 subunit gamma/tau
MNNAESSLYEVTASKYRPKTFDELAGQEFVVSTIKNSLKNGHIAHAYLFSGPRGCGKTSAARILARSLNCEKSHIEGPCGVCSNCLAIIRGASMDVLEIDGASNNSVNDVRQIKDEVLFPPQAGKFKVYIIDEVHMLSPNAFNALLKTIEEPPPYIVFIFATTELHKVPATIKSRCQQFNFRLISIEVIQGILKKICVDNGITAEEDALFWIARESTGSMRDAFTLFDQIVSFSSGNIRNELIREKLGITGLEKLNALVEACAINNSQGAFTLIDEAISSGISIEQFIIDLAGYYRNLLLMKNGVTRVSLLGYCPTSFSSKALEIYDSIRLEQALDTLLDCYRNIRYCVSPRFELETAVSKLVWLNHWVSPVELKDAISSARIVLEQSSISHVKTDTALKASRHSFAGSEKIINDSPSSRSLTDELRRITASKETSNKEQQTMSALPFVSTEDDNVPLWDNIHKKNDEKKQPSQVERILSIIPGIVID